MSAFRQSLLDYLKVVLHSGRHVKIAIWRNLELQLFREINIKTFRFSSIP